MDRKEALKILGLNEKATAEDITKRVDMLVRKFKHVRKDANGQTLADVEGAYRVLSGITYHDDKAELEKKYRKAHPNPFFKLLKVDEEKARNLIYYYKWHAIIALVAIGLIVSTIVSMVNKVEPDLRILVTGDVYIADMLPLEELIKTEIPGVMAPQIQNVYLSDTNDPQMEVAMQTKFTVEIAAGKNDVYIIDETTYLNLAKQGAFKPIEEVLDGLGTLSIEQSSLENLEVAIEIDDGNNNTPKLYGLDVTNSSVLKDAGLIGDRFIAAIGISGADTGNAVEFLKLLLE
jgi:hypothetical protein